MIVAHIIKGFRSNDFEWLWLTSEQVIVSDHSSQNMWSLASLTTSKTIFVFFMVVFAAIWINAMLPTIAYHIHSSSWRTTKYYWASIQSNMASTDFKKPKFESLLITIWAWTITACLSIKSNYLITYLLIPITNEWILTEWRLCHMHSLE